MPETLTTIERKVYHYLVDFLTENTYQPSVREIGRRFHIKSTKTVSEILQSLAIKGYIQRDPSRSRGVRLLGYEGATRTQPVPYYGKLASGDHPLVPENCLGYITVDRRFLPSESVFFLKISGDRMVGRGIFDGDYVLVAHAPTAAHGEVVAARLAGEVAVGLYERRGDAIVLSSAGSGDREVVVAPGDDFALLGKVCGVFRPFQESAIVEAVEAREEAPVS
ncbi:MAG TPA: transcriptional repressor LexA [Gemmatimonadaceae bacterium]|nr:transcriptional repressor LexA [Gemmatimonadaceae bacterium]